MQEVHLFAGWESFYVIVGSSAAALTGLQFVVMALVADSDRPGGSQEIAAFGTPTVVHFCSALLISGILTAPWPTLTSAGRATSLVGLLGLVYAVIVFRRAARQMAYKPVFEDWLWHTILPAAAYLTFLISGLGLCTRGLFFAGGAALLLVFIGIHNAWDTVTYVTLNQRKATEQRTGVPANPPAGESREP
jgi:hypothetical protein